MRTHALALASRLAPRKSYNPGSETSLLLGTARPWVVAVGQVVPLAVMAWFVPDSRAWLMFLMLFSSIAGAITSLAATRSRRMWLRCDLTRDGIFGRVEKSYWQHNAYSLAVLWGVFLVLGWYHDFPGRVMLLGTALLVIGCAVFNYLGLMITRGLGWFESVPARTRWLPGSTRW